MRRLVSVYRDGEVEHYSLDFAGLLVRGVPGYMEWRDDVPADGWERISDPLPGFPEGWREARKRHNALRLLLGGEPG